MDKLPIVDSRDDFPEMLYSLGLNGTFVEIGVERAAYSALFFRNLRLGFIQRLVLGSVEPCRIFSRHECR
jgi:hypothetical protein